MSNETQEALTPVKKKCDIEAVLGRTIHGLLQAQPNNPIIRAQCLNELKQQIPPELTTYESIKEWVESTIEPKVSASSNDHEDAVIVDAEYSYNEYGTCNYKEHHSGTGQASITNLRMRGLAGDASSFEGLVDAVRAELKEDASEAIETEGDDLKMDGNFKSSETDDHETRLLSSFESQVREWMEVNMPETLKDWGY